MSDYEEVLRNIWIYKELDQHAAKSDSGHEQLV